MSCHEIAPLLELVPLLVADEEEGLLDAVDRVALEQHLEACAACRQLADALGAAYDRESAAVEETMQPLSPDLRERVLADTLKQSASATPHVDPEAIEALRGKIGLSCSYCRDGLERAQAVFCASCLAPHHADCFAEHGRCTLPGCDETRTVRPSDAELARPRRGRLIPLVLALAGGGAAAAALGAVTLWGQLGSKPSVGIAARDPVSPAPSLVTLEEDDDGPLFVAQHGRGWITVLAHDVPLGEVLEAIGRETRRNVVVDAGVDERVTLTLERVEFDDAVAAIAESAGCRVQPLGSGVLLLTPSAVVASTTVEASVRTVLRLCGGYAGVDVILGPEVQGTLAVDLGAFPSRESVSALALKAGLHPFTTANSSTVLVTARPLPEAVRAWFRPQDVGFGARVESWILELERCPAAAVYQALGTRAGLTQVVVSPDVRDDMTAYSRTLDPRAAIRCLAAVHGHQLTFEGQTLTVTRGDWAPRVIDARVLMIQEDAVPARVTLSVGTDDGVEVGQRFTILRDSTEVGQVEVQGAERDMARCTVVFTRGDLAIAAGDAATTTAGDAQDLDQRRASQLLGEIEALAQLQVVDELEARRAELRAVLAGEAPGVSASGGLGGEIKLQGALASPGLPGVAIVNGMVVAQGEALQVGEQRVTLVEIGRGLARLRLGETEFVRELGAD